MMTLSKEINKVNFAEFLESIPPNTLMMVSDLVSNTRTPNGYLISFPEIRLHCDNEKCQGIRIFRNIKRNSPLNIHNNEYTEFYFRYICSNCYGSEKTYSLRCSFDADEGEHYCYKFGEHPDFGPQTPSRLMKFVGGDRELFFKGRKCEFQGLGIGAFTYYRRVVENQRSRIIDEIIRVSRKIGTTNEIISDLEQAKTTFKFTQSIDSIKLAIPESLLISGHNPLILLHGALSDGIHDRDDTHCLEIASSIRILLGELAERIDLALREEKELSDALTKLMKAKQR